MEVKAPPSLIRPVIQEHLNGAIYYIDEGKYSNVSIQANRMITEATLWSDETNLVLLGFALRLAHIEFEAGRSQNNGNVIISQKNAFLEFSKSLGNLLKSEEPIAAEAVWKQYHAFYFSFWSAHRINVDGKWYQPKPEFVDLVFTWAIDRMDDWSETVGEIRGNPIDGLMNEVERVVRTHGVTIRQLVALGMLQSISWRIEYAIWKTLGRDGFPDEEKVTATLLPSVKELVRIGRLPNEPEFISSSSQFIKEMMTTWRTDFVRYYDLFTYRQEQISKRILMDSSSRIVKKPKVPSRRETKEERG